MSTTVSDPGGGDQGYEPIPAGLHHGICYAVYDIGTHWTEFQGHGKWTSLVRIVWELPEVRMVFEKDGKQFNLPKSTSQEYTASLHKKANLRKMLESWRGRQFTKEELENGFELSRLLGVNCTIQIIHNVKDENTYANIANVLPLMDKSKNIGKSENPRKHFSFENNEDIPEGTPEWIRTKITQSKEWLEQFSEPSQDPPPGYPDTFDGDSNDDIPF
jgi:hypothetical protein